MTYVSGASRVTRSRAIARGRVSGDSVTILAKGLDASFGDWVFLRPDGARRRKGLDLIYCPSTASPASSHVRAALTST
jgi:hypothetical protein